MRVKLSCNLEVEINSLSVLEHDQKRHNTKLSDFFFEGKPVMIRILSLEFAEYGTFVENRDPSKLAKISVSMKESEVNKHRVYLNKLHSDRKYFMVKEEDDFPPPIKYYPRSQSFKPRNIRHPFFKNVTEEEARAWLDKFCDGAVNFLINMLDYAFSVCLVHYSPAFKERGVSSTDLEAIKDASWEFRNHRADER